MHETVAERLGSVGQRFTPKRREIVEILERAGRPLTIAAILEAGNSLAQSSVYRNLVVLEEADAVHRVVTRDGVSRYEMTEDLMGHHHHLVCTRCGSVEDVPAGEGLENSMADAVAQIDRSTGFTTDHHRLDLVGLCRRCTRPC